MKAFFKKWALFVACAAIFVYSVGYAWEIRNAQGVESCSAFYFLVGKETSDGAAEVAKWEGGAGYFVCLEGKERVAYGLYTNEREGERVCARFAEREVSTQLQSVGAKKWYFLGKNKKKRAQVVAALRYLYGEIRVVEETTAALEKGETQEYSKRTLTGVCARLRYQTGKYGAYAAFAELCARAELRLRECLEGVVRASSLRYWLCETADGYLRLEKAFSL